MPRAKDPVSGTAATTRSRIPPKLGRRFFATLVGRRQECLTSYCETRSRATSSVSRRRTSESPSQFAARGDTFRLLFGTANEPVVVAGPRDSTDTYGHAVHHAVRARVCIERGRAIQAEYWISSIRTETLALASRRAGVQDWHARGAHLLPAETRERFADALVRSLDTAELSRALNAAIGLLLDQSDQAPALAARVENHLRAITKGEAPLPAFEGGSPHTV
jgi:hypothetical protein